MWSELNSRQDAPGYQLGTYRAISPIHTMRRLKTLLVPAGITRVARVTDLDTIGVPVYQAIRPNSRNMSVSQGKGLTRTQAKVSAVMESLESFHAEEICVPSTHASVREISNQISYAPESLAVNRSGFAGDLFATLDTEQSLEWIQAIKLDDGRSSWVPRQLCELDFTIREEFSYCPFMATSNGLASGNSMRGKVELSIRPAAPETELPPSLRAAADTWKCPTSWS